VTLAAVVLIVLGLGLGGGGAVLAVGLHIVANRRAARRRAADLEREREAASAVRVVPRDPDDWGYSEWL
jgi:hypothetical protein